MVSLLFLLVAGLALLFAAKPVITPILNRFFSSVPEIVFHSIRAVGALLVAWAFLSTSYVYVGENQTAHLNKIYLGDALPTGKIIAVNGEKGPQANVLAPGFHFIPLVNVINSVAYEDVVEIPDGQYGYLVARDGVSLRPDQTFADAFDPDVATQMVTDAAYFLTYGGQKGPQTSVLGPGKYRLNRYLWEVSLKSSTDIPNGFVGVLKSNVHSRVDFGNLKTEKPTTCSPVKPQGVDANALAVPLVPRGCIGTWADPLLPGRYYINLDAYSVTQIDTRVQTWEYKGGYTQRSINLTVSQKGDIEQEVVKQEVQKPADAVDTAVIAKTDGSDIPLELRVLIQIRPENAPFVVASVGDLDDVENDILSPVIRAIVRNVTGGMIYAPTLKRDETGNVLLDNEGKPQVNNLLRPVRPLDLIENRPAIEDEVERLTRPEGAKAGVDIKEVRLGEAVVPPELLLAARRKRLAEELQLAIAEEQNTQTARIATEEARATADQQTELVKAKISLQKSEQEMQAARNQGQGERDRLALIAEGQKSQALVLGEDRVVELQKFNTLVDRLFQLVDKHPDILTAALTNAHKFVPERVVTMGEGGGNSLPAAAAIFAELFGQQKSTTAPTAVTPAGQ